MFRNYLTVAFRNLLKYKAFSAINIFGLSLGMSVCMLIILMLADQSSYDQHHLKKERIYRILSDDGSSPFPYASTPVPLAGALKTGYPQVEEATHLVKGVGGDATYNEKTVEMRGFFADQAVFEVFTMNLKEGDPAKALSLPNSMVISRRVASQLFPDEDPLDKTIEFSDRGLHYLGGYRNEPAPTPWGTFVITGVMDESPKSHLVFDVLISMTSMPVLVTERKIENRTQNWQNFYECFTYVLMNEGAGEPELNFALADQARVHYANSEFLKNFKLLSQPLIAITPGIFTANPTRFSMPRVGYYVLTALAVIIMTSAGFNYASLSIARSIARAKEVGVRKVTGANRNALIFQFLSESILTALFAMILAATLLLLVKPGFEGLWINQYLQLDLKVTPFAVLVFIGMALTIGAVAGIYPAFHISKYQPVKALKGGSIEIPNKWSIRKVLNVAQFVISILFITTSMVILDQFKHFRTFDYGLQSTSIVNIPMQGNEYDKLVHELQQVRGVTGVSACDIVPATGISNGTRLRAGKREEDYQYFGMLGIDDEFVANFGLDLLAGRNLSDEDIRAASSRLVIVNEAAVTALGFNDPSEIIGKVFEEEGSTESVEVVGVVKDFRFKLLIEQDAIGPLVMRKATHFNFVNVRLGGDDSRSALASVEERWKSIDNRHAFRYEFFSDQLSKTHQGILDAVEILGFLTVLAIVISCLGMLGMATYSAERKAREVGIRKILGAGNWSIVLLLSKGYFRILSIAVLVGAPLSYFANNLWLEKFPNRVDFGAGTFASGVFILVALGLFTIGSQTIRASKGNAVESLRND